MAINPLIPMQVQDTNLADASQNALLNYQRSADMKMRQDQAAIQKREADMSFQLKDMAQDALMVKPYLEAGDTQSALNSLYARAEKIRARGGDPKDTLDLILQVENGDIDGAINDVSVPIQAATQMGLLRSDDSGGVRMGQYNPGDYTPESWAQFVKNPNDPSVLKRYETSARERLYTNPYLAASAETVEGRIAGSKAGAAEQAKSNVQLQMKPKIQAAITEAQNKVADSVKTAVAGSKLSDATAAYDALSNSDLDLIYGKNESWYPDFFRSQKGIDLIAQRDKLIGMLQLGARGELKGQGNITEGEQGILSRASTALGNPDISPELAREELDAAMNVLRRNAGQKVQNGKYTVGQEITVNGQRYRVTGGDMNDPDVELIQ